jgi:putative inorganic carbon (HCO3(-)) transporter
MSEPLVSGFLPVVRRVAGLIAQHEIWPVAFMVAASFVWSSLLPAAVLTAAVFFIVRWIAYGRLTKRTAVDWPVILILITAIITAWVTALPSKTNPQVFRLLSGVAIFYSIANWSNTRKRLDFLLIGTTLAGLLLALFATISVQWAIGKLPFIPEQLYQKFSMLVSDTVHPNVMAGSLVILLPIPMARLFYAWGKITWLERIFLTVSISIMLAILALTQSRGSWIALAAVLLLLVILRWRWGWLILIPVTITGAAVITHFDIPRLTEVIFSSGAISGWDGRREIWSRAIYMIQDFPFTGIGMGLFTDVADTFYPFYSASPGTIEHAHNLFLQVAVDLGIPGLIAWLAILLSVIVLSWQLYRQGRRTHNALCASIGVGLLCSQAALVMHGMFDAVTWGMVRPAPIVWALWGVAIVSANLLLEKEELVV